MLPVLGTRPVLLELSQTINHEGRKLLPLFGRHTLENLGSVFVTGYLGFLVRQQLLEAIAAYLVIRPCRFLLGDLWLQSRIPSEHEIRVIQPTTRLRQG